MECLPYFTLGYQSVNYLVMSVVWAEQVLFYYPNGNIMRSLVEAIVMVIALDSRLNNLVSCPGRMYCIVFFGTTLYSHSASLHPGVQIGPGKYNAEDNPVMS